MINITELASSLTPRYCEFLLGLYCFTGEDSNCAFKGKGKVAPLKKAVQKQKFMDTFIKLGKQWGLDPDSHTELEEFTCTMYGHPRLKEVNKVRSSMMRKITGGNTTAINKVFLHVIDQIQSRLKRTYQHQMSLTMPPAVIQKLKLTLNV